MAAAAVSSGAHSRRDAIFTSVFPTTNYTTPTPESTPNIGVLASPGQPFGGFTAPINAVDDVVRFNRVWSAATRFLSLSNIKSDEDAFQRGPAVSSDVLDAITVLCASPGSRKQLEAWYSNEMGEHFRRCVLPELVEWQQPVAMSRAVELFERTVALLQRSWDHYFIGTTAVIKSTRKSHTRALLHAFDAQAKQSFHILVLTSLPRQRLQKTLAAVLFQSMNGLLSKHTVSNCFEHAECHCPISLDLPLSTLQRVSLGGNLGERAFAHAVHKLLEGPIIDRDCFRVDYRSEGQQSIVPKLRRWVETYLVPFVEQSLIELAKTTSLKLTEDDKKQFAQMAVSNLGRRRTSAIFFHVFEWPHTKGAILDIKEYITSDPTEKARVCSSFITQIQHRLLHAGPQTTEILSTYANVIHAFRLLDARGVMLEKVAGPIRSYLRSRDDTVSIIAASFLAVDREGKVVNADPAKVCADIALEVSKSTIEDSKDHKMMDWNDMSWQPDPIDAGPEYKASKSEDVMAYILGLFDQDEFIKEVTTVLAQHLLQVTDPEFVKETRLIELFKSRLDATKLQAAEVMLKDVRDSVSLNKRINIRATAVNVEPPKPREIEAAIPEEGIDAQSLFQVFEHRMKYAHFLASLKLVSARRGDRYYPKRTRLPTEPAKPAPADAEAFDHKVQVLSGFFWPQMRSNDFALPAEFVEMDVAFGQRFSLLGNQRKLHFRRALARVNVELELEDRHVSEADVPAWRASVINAFGANDYDVETGLTAADLEEKLHMEEELVIDALSFWTGRRVTYQRTPGVFAVLERLDMDIGSVMTQAQQQTEAVSAIVSQDAMLRDSAPMFETFIKGMLRDGGPKEVAGFMGITNMLKMVLPTFTYGEEEVLWLLGQMEGRGEVTSNGEVWAFVR